jgi:hypothetical protein
MRIKARMGISIDGFVSNAEGMPAIALANEFIPHRSHGFPDFIEGCDAVVMGRSTFVPALSAPSWPWGEHQVFVLTSSPLPPETPIYFPVPLVGGRRARTMGHRRLDGVSGGRGGWRERVVRDLRAAGV